MTGRGAISATARVYQSFQVELRAEWGGLDNDSKAQCEQFRAVDARRLVRKLGAFPSSVMAWVGAKLRFHVGR